MRISDWSSDVCSSDLTTTRATGSAGLTSIFSTIETRLMRWLASIGADTWIDTASSGEAAPGPSVPLIASATRLLVVKSASRRLNISAGEVLKIGRASCRERVGQYV